MALRRLIKQENELQSLQQMHRWDDLHRLDTKRARKSRSPADLMTHYQD
ncbi:MAG: DUF3136 domain-containing protein [Synechococcus sp. MED-G135]|nr:MAG: DUF3136 domain-containing protein [Synechococcus sp. MED-G135]